MDIKLELVVIDERERLEDLINDYQKEILKSDSVEEYKYLDSYWEKEDRWPYFIKVDGTVVGFVLMNSYNIIEKDAKNIAEFYVDKKSRGQGIGRTVAIKAFEMFPGKWEIREMRNNIPAQKFWRKVIEGYTKGQFKEVSLNNEKWNGFVQTFLTAIK